MSNSEEKRTMQGLAKTCTKKKKKTNPQYSQRYNYMTTLRWKTAHPRTCGQHKLVFLGYEVGQGAGEMA